MTTQNESSYLEKLSFDPSLQEQLLLSKVHDNNLLVVYFTEDALIRIQALTILFYINKSSNHHILRVLNSKAWAIIEGTR